MKIVLRPHLKIRLKERLIPKAYPEKIILEFDNKYFDIETNHQIAIKKLKYSNKFRIMASAYDIMDSEIQVITIYPTTDREIKNKLLRKRWIKYEKN